jgi:hypothetical protein
MARNTNRRPDVPAEAIAYSETVSKADLLEAALALAALCSDGGCDDLDAGLDRLIAEVNLWRANRGAPLTTRPKAKS